MFSLTIHASNYTELANIVKHLEAVPPTAAPTDLPSFLKKPSKVDVVAPGTDAPIEKKAAKKVEKAKEEVAVPTVSYDDVKEATFRLAGLPGTGPSLVKEVLADFKVDHATKLKPEEWQNYINKADAKHKENKAPENLA